MFSRLRLNTQLVLAMSAISLFAIAVMTIGMGIFYIAAAEIWAEQLPPNIQQALQKMEAGENLTAEQFAYLVTSHAGDWRAQYAGAEGYALLICSIVALIMALLLGLWLARRISRPVTSVSEAARLVAAGDLHTRAVLDHSASQEVEQLVEDFNALALELDRAERELTVGAAAIAHELRTPLTVLRGRLQGLHDGVFESTPDTIEGLISHVDALSVIVNDMRTLSLGSSGAIELNCDQFDLASFTTEVVETFRVELEQAGMQLILRLETATVSADPGRLRQVILALLENARRYASSGGIVEVECIQDDTSAKLSVLDRGPGLNSDQVDRVFDRFWRADPSRSRTHGGSGLGLAVVKTLVQAHGGTVRCSPRKGGGLEVCVSFPIHQR